MTDTPHPPPEERLRTNHDPRLSAEAPAFDPSSSTIPLRNASTLHSSLLPIRHLLHSFLSDADAARLMRVSRSFTVAVLADYTFHHHVFISPLPSPQRLLNLSQLYSRYRMRVTRLSLHPDFNSSLLDSAGRSLLPSSLVTLALGQVRRGASSLFDSDLTADEEVKSTPFDPSTFDLRWQIKTYQPATGRYDQPFLPGALPEGLRHLQLNDDQTQPLSPRAIPSTVTLLILGSRYNHPLQGVLPSSLTRLYLSDYFRQPLLPGDLPSFLRQLHCGSAFNKPLDCGTLPAGLQALHLSLNYKQLIPPDVLPRSLTHLRLGCRQTRPLHPGSLPAGLLHLTFSDQYDHPLTPGLLPASLQELVLPYDCQWPLSSTTLPPHLCTLRLPYAYEQPLLRSVLPASLRVLDCGAWYSGRVEEGVLPDGLKWLAIPREYRGDMESVLPEGCEVHWYGK